MGIRIICETLAVNSFSFALRNNIHAFFNEKICNEILMKTQHLVFFLRFYRNKNLWINVRTSLIIVCHVF